MPLRWERALNLGQKGGQVAVAECTQDRVRDEVSGEDRRQSTQILLVVERN